jgi:ATP-binding cassette subfamily F protein 3
LEQLNYTAHALAHLQDQDSDISDKEARQYLGGFNFHGDDVFRPVGEFSGGEKTRLVLALLIWQKPNLLLLDEPTNHLDMEMREALCFALQSYQGAMIMVSHDRYLLNSAVDEFYLVAKGQVATFSGDLDDYQQWLLKQKEMATAQAKNTKKPATGQVKAATKKPQKQLVKLEKDLEKLHNKLKKIDEQLNDLQQQKIFFGEELENLTRQRQQLVIDIDTKETTLLEAMA